MKTQNTQNQSVMTSNTSNEIMKSAFAKYPNAKKIVFKSDIENMNATQILQCAAAYSCMPFQAGENVIKNCASMYASNKFGTLDDFYNEVIELLRPKNLNIKSK